MGKKHEFESNVQKGEKYDITKDLDGFESNIKAESESVIRQSYLDIAINEKSRELGERLALCEKDNRCGSAACPHSAREFRRSIYAESRALYEQYGMVYIVTVVLYFDALTSKELFSMDPKLYKQRLYQQLKRAGFKGPVIGYFDIDYHTEIGRWLPHFHLLVLENDPPISELRSRFYSKKIESRSC